MKTKLLVLVVGLLCGAVGWYVGYRRGMQRVVSSQIGDFVATLDALQRLRSGYGADGIARMERHCFASAVGVLEQSGWRVDAIRKMMIPSLIEYRSTHRTNSADWTPMEVRLESLLAPQR